MIIQFVLISLSIVILLYFLSNKSSIKVRAYKKIGMFLFMCAFIVFVLYPEMLNSIAKRLGVGRGADLLLYVFFVGFLLFAINVYIKFKEQQDLIYRLARQIAILEAQSNEREN